MIRSKNDQSNIAISRTRLVHPRNSEVIIIGVQQREREHETCRLSSFFRRDIYAIYSDVYSGGHSIMYVQYMPRYTSRLMLISILRYCFIDPFKANA